MIAPPQPIARTASMSSSDAIAARGDDRAAVEADEPLVELEVRAAEEAVALDGGHLEGLDARIGESSRSRRRHRRPVAPRVQPWPTARPSRTSMATAIRAAPCASTSRPANAGSLSAAVPTTARARPRRAPPRRPRSSEARRRPRPGSLPDRRRRSRRSTARMCRRPRSGRRRGRRRGASARRPSRTPRRRDRIVVVDAVSRSKSPWRAARRGRRAGRSPAGSRRALPSPCRHATVVAR